MGIAVFLVTWNLMALAAQLEVTDGLTDYQVVQCDDEEKGVFTLSGTADTAGTVVARVADDILEVLPWTEIARVENGAWSGAIQNIPVGGPYRVELEVRDASGAVRATATVRECLVGDVWLLAGQSNMQGVGNRYAMAPPHPQIHHFAMNYQWRIAQEPLHLLQESPDPVHFQLKEGEKQSEHVRYAWENWPKGAGLGLPFAHEMLQRTGRPVGLISAAHGGTSMAQWDPAKRAQGGASLYGSMYQMVTAAGGNVRGVLWYQGESDGNPDACPIFLEKFTQLIEAMRTDFNTPDLPFYYVQIGRYCLPNGGAHTSWGIVQQKQYEYEATHEYTGMVASIDLALDDAIHVGTPGLKTLGYRLANLAEADLYDGTTLPGPRFKSVATEHTPYGKRLRVTFSGVNGVLQCAGRLSGFDIIGGTELPEGYRGYPIFKQEIDPEDPTAVLLWIEKLPENPHLIYGWGWNPYCNLTDAAQMALPVMGPIPITE